MSDKQTQMELEEKPVRQLHFSCSLRETETEREREREREREKPLSSVVHLLRGVSGMSACEASSLLRCSLKVRVAEIRRNILRVGDRCLSTTPTDPLAVTRSRNGHPTIGIASYMLFVGIPPCACNVNTRVLRTLGVRTV